MLLGSEFIYDFPLIETRIEGEICKYFSALINVDGLDGFTLTGEDGQLYCQQKPLANPSLYADYYWYELGDVIGLGDTETFFFCVPPAEVPVARIRLAAEEMYKLYKSRAIGR